MNTIITISIICQGVFILTPPDLNLYAPLPVVALYDNPRLPFQQVDLGPEDLYAALLEAAQRCVVRFVQPVALLQLGVVAGEPQLLLPAAVPPPPTAVLWI